jgi:hypothetical protein
MTRDEIFEECRRPTVKAWVGAVLVVALLVAECFAVTHPFDSEAHRDGRPCKVCLSTTALGAGAIASAVSFAVDSATAVLVATVVAIFISTVPTRRFARGPPHRSSAF